MRVLWGAPTQVLSHSLDAHSDFLVAARGQTMSLAFYPMQARRSFGPLAFEGPQVHSSDAHPPASASASAR